MKKLSALVALVILIAVLTTTKAYAADDLMGGIWETIQSILPYILTSPLLFILLFKFWGVPLVEIILKVKWLVVMIIPTIVLYISMPDIINYAVIKPPEWFMYISPPLVLDCIIGYAVATGNSTYLAIGFIWLVSIYFIAIFLILSEKRRASDAGAPKKVKSNYYYIFSPLLVWLILAMWGLLMINIHTFILDAISGALSSELVGGLQVGAIIAVIFAVVVVFMVVAKVRGGRESPEKKMDLLYCKEIDGKVLCVYDKKKEKDLKAKGITNGGQAQNSPVQVKNPPQQPTKREDR